jgi:membrane-associated phospholipid phosphatase
MTGRPLNLPPRQRLAVGFVGAAIVSLAFFPIYLGGALTTGLLDHRLHLYAGWELALPFWPVMIVPYLSMFVLFLMPVLQLDEQELIELVRRLVVASLIGGLFFLCMPTETGFEERNDAGMWQPVYAALYAIDGRANAVPSFHVIYTTSILLAFIDAATPRRRIAYGLWLVVVCASTVLTHRHHVLDVVGGFAIAWAVRAWSLRRLQARFHTTKRSSWTGAAP